VDVDSEPDAEVEPERISNALIGIAGVHHVVSELSRRGLVALPTVRNTAAYDIVVATPDGTRHANIQVKSSSKMVTFFRMPPSDRVMAGPRDFYVLLRWDEKAFRYDGFLLRGREAKDEVEAEEERQNKRIAAGSRKDVVPCITVAGAARARAARWRRQWEAWRL
jgi:hypothetical protein